MALTTFDNIFACVCILSTFAYGLNHFVLLAHDDSWQVRFDARMLYIIYRDWVSELLIFAIYGHHVYLKWDNIATYLGKSIGHQWIPLTKGPEMRLFDVLCAVSPDKLSNKQFTWRWIGTSRYSSVVIVM